MCSKIFSIINARCCRYLKYVPNHAVIEGGFQFLYVDSLLVKPSPFKKNLPVRDRKQFAKAGDDSKHPPPLRRRSNS